MAGRLEVVGRRPWVIVDGAHNPVSIEATNRVVRESFPCRKRVLVIGAAADKDVRRVLRTLAPTTTT